MLEVIAVVQSRGVQVQRDQRLRLSPRPGEANAHTVGSFRTQGHFMQ
jgi:hypothetical protein